MQGCWRGPGVCEVRASVPVSSSLRPEMGVGDSVVELQQASDRHCGASFWVQTRQH